jgi:hypothetical protein
LESRIYTLPNVLIKQDRTAGGQSRSERFARCALVVLVLLALVVTLATRFTTPIPSSDIVRSSSGQTTQQRMNQHAVRWFAPILQIGLLPLPEFRVLSAGKDQFVANLFCGQGLYNRPPPSF